MTDHTHIDARLDNALEEAFGITYINHDSRAYKIMEALINDAVREARIDELSAIPVRPNFIAEYIKDRLAALSKEKETKDD